MNPDSRNQAAGLGDTSQRLEAKEKGVHLETEASLMREVAMGE
jgi:hypothetical protein